MVTSTIAHKHHWALEAAPYTKPSPFRDGDCDGELYTERYTRGNIKGRCKDCGTRRTFHPFAGAPNLARRIGSLHAPMMAATLA